MIGGPVRSSSQASVSEEEIEGRWQAWLVQRNRQGARIAFWLTITIYPAFGLLDWLMAPPQWLHFLWATRLVVSGWSVFLLATLNRPFFARHWRLLTSMHALMLGFGIAAMVYVLGGFATPYYAGFNLSMMGVGMLFVWRPHQAAATYSAIVASYVIPNALGAHAQDWANGAPNLFFVLSTATVVTTAHYYTYSGQRAQLIDQIVLESTKANLEDAHAKLKQLDEFKSTFFANITHELKTPLAMILSPLELMIDGELGKVTDSQKATLQTMLRSGMKLLKLINDLLDLTKLEESRIRLHASEQDLTEYLRGLADQVKPLTLRKGIELTFIAPEAPFLIYCDLERLERVFINLLSNAAKFTPQEGHIQVTMRAVADGVEVEVKDDGPGFPADKAEQVFERFFQVDQSGTRRYGGTGIGLALAKELVELHGGRIWAQSEVGMGATFTVFLRSGSAHLKPDQLVATEVPLQREEGKRRDSGLMDTSVEMSTRKDYRLLDIAEASERRVVERDLDENERQWTVLIVEDNPDVIRVIHLSLRREFKVMAAPDGLKGFDLAVKEQPNLIITDLMMPGIDGLELTKRLRADPVTKYTPIIMLTARGGTEDRIAGIEQGVNAYLSKPFSAK